MLPVCWLAMRIIAGSLRSRRLEAPPGLATRPSSDRLRETLFNVLATRIEGAAFLDLYAGSGAVGLEALSRGAAQVEFVERAPAALKILRGNLERLGIIAGFRIHAVAVGAFLRKGQAASENAGDAEFHPSRQNNYAARVGHPPAHRDKAAMNGAQLPMVHSYSSGLMNGPPVHIEKQTVVSHPSRKNNYAARVGHPAASGVKFDLVFLDPPWDAAEEYAATLGLLGGSATGLLGEGALVIAEHRKKQQLEDCYGLLERTRLLEQGDAALSFYVVAQSSTPEIH
jgi:16S rRNA G966 N2-methylase RsmD